MRRKVGKMKPGVKIYLVFFTLGIIYYLFERFIYFSIVSLLVVGLFLVVVGSVTSVIIYYTYIKQTKGKTKGKKPKLKLPKDETARYKKLKDLEEESTRSHELWIKPLTEEDKKETKKEFRRFD